MEFEFTREEMKQAAPALAEYNQNVLWDDMWERPGLSKRDRSLITLAYVISVGRPGPIEFHTSNLACTRADEGRRSPR